MVTKCRYSGSTGYGSGCYHSPTGKHEHRDDEKHCEYCGSSSYGRVERVERVDFDSGMFKMAHGAD